MLRAGHSGLHGVFLYPFLILLFLNVWQCRKKVLSLQRALYECIVLSSKHKIIKKTLVQRQ